MNTQNKNTKGLLTYVSTGLLIALLITFLASCSHNTCTGVISKKPINKYIVKHSNFNKKHYNF